MMLYESYFYAKLLSIHWRNGLVMTAFYIFGCGTEPRSLYRAYMTVDFNEYGNSPLLISLSVCSVKL